MSKNSESENWFSNVSPKEPVFWISEIRILSELSGNKEHQIRLIELQKGLNIIWSEPGDPNGPKKQKGRGHAAGKTSLCRAIRYLLGEDKFGNKFVEERISKSQNLSDAILYASVWVEGVQWSVFRPLRHRKSQEFAVKDADFHNSIKEDKNSRLDYEEFTKQLHDSVTSPFQVKHFDHAQTDEISWLDILMPLARDQEAHLTSIHNWRDVSASQTPSKFSPSTKAFLMRCLLGIADPKEAEQLQKRDMQNSIINRAENILTTYRQVLKDDIQFLENEFKISLSIPEPDEIDSQNNSIFIVGIRTKALEKANLEKNKINKKILLLKIPKLKESVVENKEKLSMVKGRIEQDLEILEAQKRNLKLFDIKEPTKKEKEQSICDKIFINASKGGKFCKVPIQDAMEHCNHYWDCEIKKRLAEEPKTVTAEYAEQKKRAIQEIINELNAELKPSLDEITKLNKEIKRLESEIENKEKHKKVLEFDFEELNEIFATRIQSARSITNAITKQDSAKSTIKESNAIIKSCEQILSDLRENEIGKQNQISSLFDFVIKKVVSDELSGELIFSKIDINASLRREGELESEAYKALRALSYDYTALIGRLCGLSNHPGFLLHDSPRESDLEHSLYQQLFTFIHELETKAPTSFQYIVTTTETPPKQLIDTHVRVNLDGSTKQGRLYCENL